MSLSLWVEDTCKKDKSRRRARWSTAPTLTSNNGIGLMRAFWALVKDQGKDKETSEEATGQSG